MGSLEKCIMQALPKIADLLKIIPLANDQAPSLTNALGPDLAVNKDAILNYLLACDLRLQSFTFLLAGCDFDAIIAVASTTVVDRRRAEAIRAFDSGSS